MKNEKIEEKVDGNIERICIEINQRSKKAFIF